MAELLERLGFQQQPDVLYSEHQPSSTRAEVLMSTGPLYPDLNPREHPTAHRFGKMPLREGLTKEGTSSERLSPLPPELIKKVKAFYEKSFAGELLEELEEADSRDVIDVNRRPFVTLYKDWKQYEAAANRKSSRLALEKSRSPDQKPPFSMVKHEFAHLGFNDPLFAEALEKVEKSKGLPSLKNIGGLEEAVIRYTEQEGADSLKNILRDYAVLKLPIINDPNIWESPDKERLLYALSGMLYDHVSGPDGRRPFDYYKGMTREDAVPDIAHHAKVIKYYVDMVLDNLPLVVEEMDRIRTSPPSISKESVEKFAAGGLVEKKLTEDSYGGLSSLVNASPDYELAPIGIASMQDQVQKLSEFGRNGDVYIIHAAEGETVIPMEVLEANPQIKTLLFNQMAEMGLDPQRYVVGDQLNSLNPVTGMPEFFFSSIFKGIKKAVKAVAKVVKKVAPIALPIAASVFGIPFLGPMFAPGSIGAAALSSGIGTLIGGGNLKDAFKSAAIAGGTAGVFGGLKGLAAAPKGSGFSGFGAGVKSAWTGTTPIYDAAGQLIGTQAAPTAGKVWENITSGDFSKALMGAGGEFTPEAGWTGNIDPLTKLPVDASRYIAPPVTTSEAGWTENLPFGARIDSKALPTGAGTTGGDKVADAGGSLFGKLSPTKILGLSPEGSTAGDVALGLGATALLGGFETAEGDTKEEILAGGIGAPFLTRRERLELAEKEQLAPSSLNPFLHTPDPNVLQPTIYSAQGGSVVYPRRELLVEGPGTEQSDDIPAMLSDGEFVINSRAVRGADPSGRGNRYAGAQNLYNLMRNFEMRA